MTTDLAMYMMLTHTHAHKHHTDMYLMDDLLEVGNMENSSYSKQLQEVENCNRTCYKKH